MLVNVQTFGAYARGQAVDNTPLSTVSLSVAGVKRTEFAQGAVNGLAEAAEQYPDEVGQALVEALSALSSGSANLMGNTLIDLPFTPGFAVSSPETAIRDALQSQILVDMFGSVNNALDALDSYNSEIIQRAIDACAADTTRTRSLKLPPGNIVCHLTVPEYVQVFAEGHSETTSVTVTRLIQPPTGGSVVKVRGHSSGSRKYWAGNLFGFSIFGDPTSGSGFGIDFTDGTGAPVTPQDTTYIHDMSIRGMPSGGINFPNGALPLSVARIKLLWNGGPGITFKGTDKFSHQSVHFEDVSGDGNIGGLFHFEGVSDYGTILITNMKSERRVNSQYGNVDAQVNPIIWKNNDVGSILTINTATMISSVPDGSGNFLKPGDMIALTGGAPTLPNPVAEFRTRPGDTGPDPKYISSYGGSATVDGEKSLVYFTSKERVDLTPFSQGLRSFGPIGAYQLRSVEDVADQVGGSTPARTLYETDAPANKHLFGDRVSGGSLLEFSVDDAGTSHLRQQFDLDASGIPTRRTSYVIERPTLLTIATLPAAASNPYFAAVISDFAVGEGPDVRVWAGAWHYIGTGNLV